MKWPSVMPKEVKYMEKCEITEEVRKVLLEAAEHYEGLAACLRSLYSEKKKDEDDGQLMLPLSDEKEEKPVITLEQVRSVLAGKSRDGYTAEVRAIITRHGANRLSEIKPEDYAAVLKEAEELGNA